MTRLCRVVGLLGSLGSAAAAAAAAASNPSKSSSCAALQTLEFEQKDAPADISRVLGKVTALINDAASDAVTDVSLTWEGEALHHMIGTHSIVANVETVSGARLCYATSIVIRDTDECLERRGAWRHNCSLTAKCVNTVGSYECACEPDAVGAFNTEYDCEGFSTTASCCGSYVAGTPGMSACAGAFVCEGDLCGERCDKRSQSCKRHLEPTATAGRQVAVYDCACPPGYVGDGSACPGGAEPQTVYVDKAGVIIGGGTAQQHALLPSKEQPMCVEAAPCGCALPVFDACAGLGPTVCGAHARCVNDASAALKYVCECAEGFERRANDDTECVDLTLPQLSLNGGKRVVLNQCSDAPYEELGVRVVDENAADYERTLRIHYSEPADFPSRAAANNKRSMVPYFRVGSYRVTYRVDTPWTDPPFVEATRQVVVQDIDECALANDHPCAANCAKRANCQNEVGGYRCVCPEGTTGDGFARSTPWANMLSNGDNWRLPETFAGGTGCSSNAPPTLKLLGADPLTITIPRRVTLLGEPDERCPVDAEAELTALVLRAPERLCPSERRCAEATQIDAESGERRDVSAEIRLLKPVRVKDDSGDDVFEVPYTVADDGGHAVTLSRVVRIRQVDVADIQAEAAASAAAGAATTRAATRAAVPPPPPRSCPKPPPCPQLPTTTTTASSSSSRSSGSCPDPSAHMRRIESLEEQLAIAKLRANVLGWATLFAVGFGILALAFAQSISATRSTLSGPSVPLTPSNVATPGRATPNTGGHPSAPSTSTWRHLTPLSASDPTRPPAAAAYSPAAYAPYSSSPARSRTPITPANVVRASSRRSTTPHSSSTAAGGP